jgi:cytidylate kinase
MKITVAIDGYSSCGKSTLAKQLAKALGYSYVDTGAMYRAVTLYFIRNQVDLFHPDQVANALQNIVIDFKVNTESQQQDTYLNGENIENEIRVNQKGIVMDGRDIGTVVFPNAELKLFVTADPQVRAQRRLDELVEKGQTTTFDEVLANLEKRDHIDSNREDSPLKQADDAVILDNSNMTREEQFDWVMKWVNQKIGLAEN